MSVWLRERNVKARLLSRQHPEHRAQVSDGRGAGERDSRPGPLAGDGGEGEVRRPVARLGPLQTLYRVTATQPRVRNPQQNPPVEISQQIASRECCIYTSTLLVVLPCIGVIFGFSFSLSMWR